MSSPTISSAPERLRWRSIMLRPGELLSAPGPGDLLIIRVVEGEVRLLREKEVAGVGSATRDQWIRMNPGSTDELVAVSPSRLQVLTLAV